MKKIGIIGGIGPESTVDYYKQIISAFKQKGDGLHYPEIIIFSADLSELLDIIDQQQWDQMTGWLLDRILALDKAGAEFAAIASNTPHAVFDEVQSRSPIPLVSIVEETAKKAAGMNLRKLGLLGTQFTMASDFYPHSFREKGMSMVVPGPEDQTLIQKRLFSEIELGIIKESTRQELQTIIQTMIDTHAIDGLILGCTELPLILTKDYFDIPFLNTTTIHADSIVRYCIED